MPAHDAESPRPPRVAIGRGATEIECAVVLAGLPNMGPSRLGALVRMYGAGAALDHITSGQPIGIDVPQTIRTAWRVAASSMSPSELMAMHQAASIGSSMLGHVDFPDRLIKDPEPPIVLFSHGDPSTLHRPTVGIVGTRRCTRYGRDVAFELGCVLGNAGVAVVSGLALGIDAAAHAGVIEAGGSPVGVVAGGLDMVYPRQNRDLWSAVARLGVIFSEHPLGTPSARWAFPARNRIIAGLSDVVVVVESPQKGGSLYTVDAALERDRPIFAVPGPIRSEASSGTNRLLADGALPMCRPSDVLEALDLSGVNSAADTPLQQTLDLSRGGTSPHPDVACQQILGGFGWEARSIDELIQTVGLSPSVVGSRLQLLITEGWVVQRGGVFERITKSGDSRKK